MADQIAPDDSRFVVEQLAAIRAQLRTLQQADGTQTAQTVKQLRSLVDDIQARLDDYIANDAYNKAQIDNLIAHPPAGSAVTGNISTTGDVDAAGQVRSTQAFKSPGSRAYVVTGSYVTTWTDGDGTIGYSPSNAASKKDLEPMVGGELLNLTPYWGRYVWDDEDSPLKVFLIAEDVHDAGFGPDVAPLDENGDAFTVNYSQLVVPLLAEIKKLSARLDAAGF